MILVIVFIASFCSMSYQLLIAHTVSAAVQEQIFSQSLTFGCYLLSLGIGAGFSRRIKQGEELKKLLSLEILLACLGGISASLVLIIIGVMDLGVIYKITRSVSIGNYLAALSVQPLTMLVGFLSGIEVTLLSQIVRRKTGNEGRFWAISYSGGLLAALLLPLFLEPHFHRINIALLIGALNLLLVTFIYLIWRRSVSLKYLYLAPAIAAFLFVVGQYTAVIHQYFLKRHYLNLRVNPFSLQDWSLAWELLHSVGNVPHTRSMYQSIDIIDNDSFFKNFLDRPSSKTLYLNRHSQFATIDWHIYHELAVMAGFNLRKNKPVRRVLILGGGDGLLARTLFDFFDVPEITLIELDPMVVKMVSEHESFSKLNKNVFKDKRLNLIIGDAFSYAKRSKEKYDLIFVDFPFPDNYDLSRLYSVEFYTYLHDRLTPDGIAILDAPVILLRKDKMLNGQDPPRPTPQDIILSTLRAAGFPSVLPFGKLEPFFAISPTKRTLVFDYDIIPEKIHTSTMMSFVDTTDQLGTVFIKDAYVNSIFRPIQFR